jgi:hypothetical protein
MTSRRRVPRDTRRRPIAKPQPPPAAPVPPAAELERWSYAIVERDAPLAARVHAFALVDATQLLIAAGAVDHDLVGFAARDDRGEIDPTDGSYRCELADVGATARFRGNTVVAAWFAALAIPDSRPTLATWRAHDARARRRGTTLRALDRLRLEPDDALERACREPAAEAPDAPRVR